MSKTKKEFHVDSSISDEWIAHALNAQPANRPLAEKHIKSAYRHAGLIVPEKVLWMESPLQGALAAIIVQKMMLGGNISALDLSWNPKLDKLITETSGKIYYRRDDKENTKELLNQKLETFDDLLDDAHESIKAQAERISNEAVPQIWERVGEKVGAQLTKDVFNQLWKLTFSDSSDSQSRDELWDELKMNVTLKVLDSFIQGNLSEKNCYFDCFLRNLDLQADEVIDPKFLWDGAAEKSLADALGHCGLDTVKSIVEANKHCGYWWPLRGSVIAIEKHSSIHLDEWRRLHCGDDMAIQYPDGWGVYAWKGVLVPKKVIVAPEILTVREIDTENNAEIRRVMLERFGWGRYLDESNSKPVHKDKFGFLYRREIPDDEPLVMVKVKNKTAEPDGSFKDYFLRVPPEMETAKQAVAWTFAMEKEEYQPFCET